MIDKNTHIVFDLDDTLYKEIDYIKSAYIYINNYVKFRYNIDLSNKIEECVNQEVNFFDLINSKLPQTKTFTLEKYLELYRFHYPEIKLSKDTSIFLDKIFNQKIDFSIITDGRSVSQKNKIKALDLYHLVKNIIISDETGFEKPDLHNFKLIEDLINDKKFIYVGDNPSKDFLAPNALNWDTYCLLDNGQNIHKQKFDLDERFMPKKIINSLNELI